MKVPQGKRIMLTFVSEMHKDVKKRWAVNVVFEGGATNGDKLLVMAEDAIGNTIDSAIFEFAGCAIKIKNGKGYLLYDDFIKGKHATAVWLRRKGEEPIPGLLTFA